MSTFKKIWDVLVGSFGNSTSPFLNLNMADIKKAARTAALVGLSATLVSFSGALGDMDLGLSKGLILSVTAASIELVQRWLKDNATKK